MSEKKNSNRLSHLDMGKIVIKLLLKKTHIPLQFSMEEIAEIGEALEQQVVGKFLITLQNPRNIEMHARKFVKEFWPALRERISVEKELAEFRDETKQGFEIGDTDINPE